MLRIYLISARRSVLSFQSVLSLATTDYDGTEEKTILYQSPPILNVHPILTENHLFEFTTRLLETESARGFTRSRLGGELIIAPEFFTYREVGNRMMCQTTRINIRMKSTRNLPWGHGSLHTLSILYSDRSITSSRSTRHSSKMDWFKMEDSTKVEKYQRGVWCSFDTSKSDLIP